MTDAAPMVEWYAQPHREPDGRTTFVVRQYTYTENRYHREIVSYHETREEAQREVDRRYGR